MNSAVFFWIVFAILLIIIVLLDRTYGMLRDTSTGFPKPYSFARVQLAWWMLIILSSLSAIILAKGTIPTLNTSTLVILGISAGTTVAARIIDISDQTKTEMLNRNFNGENFFLDILSDKDGVSIHRFQSVIIHIIFGAWFIWAVLHNLTGNPCLPGNADCFKHPVDFIIPMISDNNLILLGLSSGTYAALKSTENKIV